MTSEEDELLDHLVANWIEVYKKSAVTWIVLALVQAHRAAQVSELGQALLDATGWRLTERGLYRTLSRMVDQGLLSVAAVDAARTGAKRKVFSLTPLGERFLGAVRSELVDLSAR